MNFIQLQKNELKEDSFTHKHKIYILDTKSVQAGTYVNKIQELIFFRIRASSLPDHGRALGPGCVTVSSL